MNQYRLKIVSTARDGRPHEERFLGYLNRLGDHGFVLDLEEQRDGRIEPCVAWNPGEGVYRVEIAEAAARARARKGGFWASRKGGAALSA